MEVGPEGANVAEDELRSERVRFYGPHDLATGWYLQRVVDVASQFEPSTRLLRIMDVLELHNVEKYLEHELLPTGLGKAERNHLLGLVPDIHRTVARFFSEFATDNVSFRVEAVDYEFHSDLIDLLGQNKAFDRIEAAVMFAALRKNHVNLGNLLASEKLVRAYGEEVRKDLMVAPRNAEILIRKNLGQDPGPKVYLPAGFTPSDAKDLIERYLADESANLNYVRLVAKAHDFQRLGIDAKLRLRAKRRSAELSAKLFAENDGFRTGCDVLVVDDQSDPVVFDVDSSDGAVLRYSYSRRWLDDTTDSPSILNNFQHLFEFADDQVLLTLPSQAAALGVMERVMGMVGATEYKVGVRFRNADARSLLQTTMLRNFLRAAGVDLERVLQWFFEQYLVEEFDAQHFTFTPSGEESTYLEKVRHLFSEMESVANQFGLFAESGYLDRELLSIAGDQVRYKDIPSLLADKYALVSKGSEIEGILHLLFSDQSGLLYINDGLHGDDAVQLILDNRLTRTDFRRGQRSSIDFLIGHGILDDSGTFLRFVDLGQLAVLANLFHSEAVSYYRLTGSQRVQVDAMVAKGWVARHSSLLTACEGDYFNFFLNKVGFSNGLNLRNLYLHGSQPNSDEDAHFNAYLIALRLTVALVIKINDDFCLSASYGTGGGESVM